MRAKECCFEEDVMLPIAVVVLAWAQSKPRRVGVPAGADPAAASEVAAPVKSAEPGRGLKARPARKL